MLATERNGTLYVGVTSNLVQRVWQHREAFVEGLTSRYNIHRLVW
ncbi:GIY-YIG nuclease family protein [Dyella sp.]